MRFHPHLRRPARGAGIARRARRREPGLEMLEGRRLLSTVHDVLDIADTGDNSVQQFDASTGAYLGALVASGSGGLDGPRGVIDASNGQLLVVNQNVDLTVNGEIDRYNARTGASLGPLVAASDPNAPFAPRGMVVEDGIVYVANLQDNTDSTANGEIKEYSAVTGKFLGNLYPTGFAGKFNPKALVFGPDGDLYVSSFDTANPLVGDILKFSATTGSYVVVAFNNGNGVADPGETRDLHRPEGLAFGPGGNLYVTCFRANASFADKILVLSGATGKYRSEIDLDSVGGDRAFAEAIVFGPGGYLFVPISGNGPDTGAVRRYNVITKTYTDFIAPGGPLESPWYLTFGETDPATLAYNPEHGASSGIAAPAGQAQVDSQISGLVPLQFGANVDQTLAQLDPLHPPRRRPVR